MTGVAGALMGMALWLLLLAAVALLLPDWSGPCFYP